MTDWGAWLREYFERFAPAFAPDVADDLARMHDLVVATRDHGRKLMLAGNGAAATIASHSALDFTKQAKVRAMAFNDPALITAWANDAGYAEFIARAIDAYHDPGDAVVLISVSGTSPNVLRAGERARELGLTLVTFSARADDNPLRQMGDINFWIGTDAYNVAETVHMLWLSTVVDMVMGRAEYTVS